LATLYDFDGMDVSVHGKGPKEDAESTLLVFNGTLEGLNARSDIFGQLALMTAGVERVITIPGPSEISNVKMPFLDSLKTIFDGDPERIAEFIYTKLESNVASLGRLKASGHSMGGHLELSVIDLAIKRGAQVDSVIIQSAASVARQGFDQLGAHIIFSPDNYGARQRDSQLAPALERFHLEPSELEARKRGLGGFVVKAVAHPLANASMLRLDATDTVPETMRRILEAGVHVTDIFSPEDKITSPSEHVKMIQALLQTYGPLLNCSWTPGGHSATNTPEVAAGLYMNDNVHRNYVTKVAA
jgi:hypothetical protein